MGKIDQNCRIYFSLKDIDPYYKQSYNDKYMDTIKHALSEVGFNLILGEDHVSLSVNPEKYNRQKTRKAGRHKKYFSNEDSSSLYHYSDIIFMAQSMTDIQIIQTTGMAEATYYRHKKNMKNSEYYKHINPSETYEKIYLESLPGNYLF